MKPKITYPQLMGTVWFDEKEFAKVVLEKMPIQRQGLSNDTARNVLNEIIGSAISTQRFGLKSASDWAKFLKLLKQTLKYAQEADEWTRAGESVPRIDGITRRHMESLEKELSNMISKNRPKNVKPKRKVSAWQNSFYPGMIAYCKFLSHTEAQATHQGEINATTHPSISLIWSVISHVSDKQRKLNFYAVINPNGIGDVVWTATSTSDVQTKIARYKRFFRKDLGGKNLEDIPDWKWRFEQQLLQHNLL